MYFLILYMSSSLFLEELENYDFTGDNLVTRQQGERITVCAEKAGGQWKAAINELLPG